MAFWIVSALIAASAALLIALALLRGRQLGEPAAAYDLRLYRQQLRDVDKDLARGVIGEADAERTRTEISRRILAADAQLQKHRSGSPQPKALTRAAALLAAALVIGGTLVLYRQLGAPGYGDLGLKHRISLAQERAANRPGQAEAEARLPAQPAPEVEESYANLVAQLRETAGKRPDDPQGQALLAQHEANLGNFRDAYAAKQNVIRLKGEAATARDYGELAELMILAAGGYVSPEAEEALNQALARNPRSGPARYYMGVMLGQAGRPDAAFRIWAETLRDGPAGAPWVQGIEAQIEDMAARAGVEYRPVTPPPAAADGTALPGPSAEDIANAAEMEPEAQQEMIRGMVSRLSDRLASEGGAAEEWARLITALGVLGEADRARAIYGEAQTAFAGNDTALAQLAAAAQAAGVAE
ncbi:c-type cytochrome biogenesis protein CcmI [Cribrihabitans neustonicus]|uniref:c-type cytochrome biogenesis protein CcmI n=1 Tax=Cribrihabitans neustonicus TaxID=1429085 RepID=UPI003B58FAF4